MTNMEIIQTVSGEIVSSNGSLKSGQVANEYAAQSVFAEYKRGKAPNTIRRQQDDLKLFEAFLIEAGEQPGDMFSDPEAWKGVTWGLVAAFRQWLLNAGYAVSSANIHLSTVRAYAGLACKFGAIDEAEGRMIASVKGYSLKEARHIDNERETVRIGHKKEQATRLSEEQAEALKTQPDTPQGRRDALLMCLLLELGLRCGEVESLTVNNLDLKAGTLTVYRQKVGKWQTHELKPATYRAALAWANSGDMPTMGSLLRASSKGGKLTTDHLSTRAITKRVAFLGKQIGIARLSAHDCRHYWATSAIQKGTDIFALRDAGGWSSLAMPNRYVEESKIANKNVHI